MVWFRLNIGRKQNADPRWLLPLLCRSGGVTKTEIGVISILERETKFQIVADCADAFQAAAHNAKPKQGHITRIGPNSDADDAAVMAAIESIPTAPPRDAPSQDIPVVATGDASPIIDRASEPRFKKPWRDRTGPKSDNNSASTGDASSSAPLDAKPSNDWASEQRPKKPWRDRTGPTSDGKKLSAGEASGPAPRAAKPSNDWASEQRPKKPWHDRTGPKSDHKTSGGGATSGSAPRDTRPPSGAPTEARTQKPWRDRTGPKPHGNGPRDAARPQQRDGAAPSKGLSKFKSNRFNKKKRPAPSPAAS